MVVFNASFMMERELEEEFVSWLRAEVRQLDLGSADFGLRPQHPTGETDGSSDFGLRPQHPTGAAERAAGFGAANPRISAMREAGGVDYREAEAQSVAFQVEFGGIDAARKWSREVFATLAARFEERFGPQAMVFTSVFEVIG